MLTKYFVSIDVSGEHLAKIPYLATDARTGLLYFRRVVPSRLRQILGNTSLVAFWGSRNWRDIAHRHHEKIAETDRLIADADRQLTRGIDDQSISAWFDSWYASIRERISQYPRLVFHSGIELRQDVAEWARDRTGIEVNSPAFDALVEECEFRLAFMFPRDYVGVVRRSAFREWVEATYSSLGPAPIMGEGGVIVERIPMYEVVRRQAESAYINPIASDKDPVQAAEVGEFTLEQASVRWRVEAAPTAKTADEADSAIKRFHIAIGRVPAVNQITKADVAKFQEQVLAEGTSRQTVNKLVNLLRAVLNVATRLDMITSNPAAKMTLKVDKPTKRRGIWTPEFIEAWFRTPFYTQGERPRGCGGEAVFWLVPLALFHGCRVEELGQLDRSDVRKEDGVWVLQITNEGEGQTVKNNKPRIIPLHAAVLQAGFLEFVATVKEGRLFPELRRSKYGDSTQLWSKWFLRQKRKYVTDKSTIDFHGLRHTFKRACRDAGIDEEVHDLLTGHSSSAVGRRYGEGMNIHPLKDMIDRVTYSVSVPTWNKESNRRRA